MRYGRRPGVRVTGGSGAAPTGWLDRPWREAPWVVVDAEGNGRRPPDLVEAACLPVDDGRPGTGRSWLVRPPRAITGMVTRIHGIHNANIADAPTIAQVADALRDALAGRVVVGHHVGVDLAVLHRELDGWTPPAVLDTLRLAKQIWPGLPSYRLDALTQRIGHTIPPAGAGRRHRAGHDAALTAGLFLAVAATIDTVAGGQLTARQLLARADPARTGLPEDGPAQPARPPRTGPAPATGCSDSGPAVKIAVAGTHSTGKTTFLTRLRHLLETAGYHVASVSDQAAAARDHGFPILREQTATSTLWIVTTGIAAELAAGRRADIVLVDRPITDALAYHLAAHTWRADIPDPATSAFLADIGRHHAATYDLVYRTVVDPALGIADDGHRDTDPTYRRHVDNAITALHDRLGMTTVPLRSTRHTAAVRHALQLARRTLPRPRRSC